MAVTTETTIVGPPERRQFQVRPRLQGYGGILHGDVMAWAEATFMKREKNDPES